MSIDGLEFIDTELRMPGGFVLPVRTTIVRTADACIVISPGSRVSDDQWRAIGHVTDIVAPNSGHAAGVSNISAVYPGARLWGPVGIDKKYPSLRWTGTLGTTPWPYGDTLAMLPIDGVPSLQEYVFHHRTSRSLIATDLVFNMVNASGLLSRIMLGMLGTWRRFAVSRLIMLLAKDRAALRRSLAAVVATDFDNVVPGHGALVVGDGKARLVAALRERGLVD